jgi:hypothetical protein
MTPAPAYATSKRPLALHSDCTNLRLAGLIEASFSPHIQAASVFKFVGSYLSGSFRGRGGSERISTTRIHRQTQGKRCHWSINSNSFMQFPRMLCSSELTKGKVLHFIFEAVRVFNASIKNNVVSLIHGLAIANFTNKGLINLTIGEILESILLFSSVQDEDCIDFPFQTQHNF